MKYSPIEDLYKSDARELEIFSIDVLVDVPTNGVRPLLEYEIVHRLPPYDNGTIFLQVFDSGGDQFDDRWFPYYKRLTQFVAKVTGGKIATRDHERIFKIDVSSPMTKSVVLEWIKSYKKNTDIRVPCGRIRLK